MVIATALLTPLLGGCGSQSTPAPLPVATLLDDLNYQAAGSRYAYTSVLVTSGHGSRHFFRGAWPRHIAVEMSCRGGRLVGVKIGGRPLVEVGCAPGQAGGTLNTIGRATTLTAIASPRTRWSLVVAAGHR